jgi:uroporphyrinogen-III synthase
MSDIYVLSQKVYEGAKNLPVIVFDYYDKSVDIDPYDALIFTSKNGVMALDAVNSSWKTKDIYSIGTATSKAVRQLGGNVVYEAKSSYGDHFAEEIKARLSGKRVLFLRAKVVTSRLNEILKEAGVMLDEEIIYETSCNSCKNVTKPPEGSVIIFSSPSTIECFLHCFSWDRRYKAVVIGEKTASYMPKEIPFVMSERQTIPACIEKAQVLLPQKSL